MKFEHLNQSAYFEICTVPFVSCPHCGESYLTAETLHHIEQIKQKQQQVAVERPVAVASYG